MKKILYINGNPQIETASYSRKVVKYLLEQTESLNTSIELEVINVYDEDITLIDADVLAAWGQLGAGQAFETLSQAQQDKISSMNALLRAFKEADEYIIGTPMWNFSLPPMLKAYIDNIMIAGETFKYTENGPVGLLEKKKATIVQASGGVYSQGPAAMMDHGIKYLETVFQFIGVNDINKIYVEGTAMPTKTEEEKLQAAFDQVDGILGLIDEDKKEVM